MALPSQPGEYLWAREGEIPRCPRHGWEFDVTTGRSICNPNRVRVRTYEVTLEACLETEEEPGVEMFSVSVEVDRVFLHLTS